MLEEFDRRLSMILEQFGKYNKLDENTIERVLTSQSKDDYTSSKASGEVIVHGVNGRVIKAQTANQLCLTKSRESKTMKPFIKGMSLLPSLRLKSKK